MSWAAVPGDFLDADHDRTARCGAASMLRESNDPKRDDHRVAQYSR
jgi:hypothetical protein